MMKRILFTGGTGFMGRNVLPVLSRSFEVCAPRRGELDLLDSGAVARFLDKGQFDAVIHCANPNPVKNPRDDSADRMYEESLRMFMSFYAARGLCGKLIYTGSGAEYDKRLDIVNVREEECFRSLPADGYGHAKYIMNLLADRSDNVYNLCVFACYGPHDYSTKFITHCIDCCSAGQSLTIRQDCRFDFLHVSDLAVMMAWLVENEPKAHMYNASGGDHRMLSEIATRVKAQMNSDVPIQLLSPGLNREYTACGERLAAESGLRPAVSLDDGIRIQIEWQTKEGTNAK